MPPNNPGIADDWDGWLSPEEQAAWRTYIDTSQHLFAALTESLAQEGVSLADYRILVLLSENDDLRMSDLADGITSSRSRVSRQVARLADAGLVERLSVDSDARGRRARLTDAGWARLRALAPGHVDDVRRLMIDQLSAEERDVIATVFTRVGKHLRATRTGK